MTWGLMKMGALVDIIPNIGHLRVAICTVWGHLRLNFICQSLECKWSLLQINFLNPQCEVLRQYQIQREDDSCWTLAICIQTKLCGPSDRVQMCPAGYFVSHQSLTVGCSIVYIVLYCIILYCILYIVYCTVHWPRRNKLTLIYQGLSKHQKVSSTPLTKVKKMIVGFWDLLGAVKR